MKGVPVIIWSDVSKIKNVLALFIVEHIFIIPQVKL